MDNFQKIKINNESYLIIDSIQNLRAEDSFIHRNNKLAVFGGNGEARKYVGSYVGDNGKRLSDFFEYHQWGCAKTKDDGRRDEYPIIQENCFFSKTNLLKYLYDARIEYAKKEQHYHNDITQYYDTYLKSITDLPNEINIFSIHDVSDLVGGDPKRRRGYIRSDNEIWATWRNIVLPKISYLSILKLIPEKMQGKEIKPSYYFRIFLDYQFRSIVHPQLATSLSEITAKLVEQKRQTKTISRKGQSEYRRKVIDHMPQCPFTLITDEALLKASHIKPYAVCIKEGFENEALDYLNGLTLTPTYDWLFDQGYITFTDDGHLICGAQLSAYTWSKLNINPNAKNKLRIYPEGREKYLEYHRQFVFQDNIDDFL